MKKTLALILALALLCTAGIALADYPDKPITLICGYAACSAVSSPTVCRKRSVRPLSSRTRPAAAAGWPGPK